MDKIFCYKCGAELDENTAKYDTSEEQYFCDLHYYENRLSSLRYVKITAQKQLDEAREYRANINKRIVYIENKIKELTKVKSKGVSDVSILQT